MSDANQKTLRTVLQTVLGLAAGLPLIVDAAGVPQTTAGVTVVLAVAAAVTRVMALPVVQNLLPNWLYSTDRVAHPTIAVVTDRPEQTPTS
ncbi:hypothetical protein ACGFRG_05750 [Streptomyces sp. NPDC048696]|uniref:hypothetical protein n=1 Tax=Streptomyces sp. NPDC048696 TaxID=3365585 RepID=UPI0037156D87